MHRPPLEQLRFERDVAALHFLGLRALAEFLDELTSRVGGGAACRSMLIDYGRVTPEVLRAVGGDRFPPRPVRAVSA
jgi:hypothetical protein